MKLTNTNIIKWHKFSYKPVYILNTNQPILSIAKNDSLLVDRNKVKIKHRHHLKFCRILNIIFINDEPSFTYIINSI